VKPSGLWDAQTACVSIVPYPGLWPTPIPTVLQESRTLDRSYRPASPAGAPAPRSS
jgi:hypothetical protein